MINMTSNNDYVSQLRVFKSQLEAMFITLEGKLNNFELWELSEQYNHTCEEYKVAVFKENNKKQ